MKKSYNTYKVYKSLTKDAKRVEDIETRYLLLMVYLSYITFDERIEYDYPYRKKENE